MKGIKLDRQAGRIGHFLAVARCGNMHVAARQLNITQSALSRSIQKLETAVGVVLFERSVAGTSLTKFGAIFLDHAVTVEADLAHASKALDEAQSGDLGQLRVAAGPVWLSVVLPRVVARLRQYQSKPFITCVQSPGSAGLDRLLANEYDILCDRMDERFRNPALSVDRKAQVDMCLVVGANHPLVGRSGARALREAIKYPFVMFAGNTITHRVLAATLEQRGLPFPTVAMETGSLLAVFNVLRETDYVAFVAAPLALHTRQLDLVAIKLEPLFRYETGLAYRHSLKSLGIFRAFEAELDNALRALRMV
jgi:DNA-binding transcriptional LysR family regulator